nr:hypothetical protein [Tanacetum cinerariifolium]
MARWSPRTGQEWPFIGQNEELSASAGSSDMDGTITPQIDCGHKAAVHFWQTQKDRKRSRPNVHLKNMKW